MSWASELSSNFEQNLGETATTLVQDKPQDSCAGDGDARDLAKERESGAHPAPSQTPAPHPQHLGTRIQPVKMPTWDRLFLTASESCSDLGILTIYSFSPLLTQKHRGKNYPWGRHGWEGSP